MIRIVHLLDDFGMGGVTRALSLFDDPRLRAIADSCTRTIGERISDAQTFDADMIVIHTPARWSRLPYLAALRMRNPQARIIQVEHSYTRQFEASKVSNRTRFRLMIRMAASMVDEIVAVSQAQREWLVEAGVPAAKVTAIHPWCGRFSLERVPSVPVREGPLELLAYGRLSAEKNFTALVEAMGQFSADEVRLTLFGDGPEKDTLTEVAYGRDNVTLLPACTDPAPYLASCHAVVVPSLYEAFGLVATEARMAGRAILTSPADGLPEQVKGGGGIVCPVDNGVAIARGIRRLLDADLAAMGAAGRASVANQHNQIIAGWCNLIQRASGSI